jgi:hypothetical protein
MRMLDCYSDGKTGTRKQTAGTPRDKRIFIHYNKCIQHDKIHRN